MFVMQFFSEVSCYEMAACLMAEKEGDTDAAEVKRALARLAIRAGEVASLDMETDGEHAEQRYQEHVREAVHLLATWYGLRHPGATGESYPHEPLRRIETVREGVDLLRKFLPTLPEKPPAETHAEQSADILDTLRANKGLFLTSTIPIADLQGIKKIAPQTNDQTPPGLDTLVLKALHVMHADSVTLTPLEKKDGELQESLPPVEAKLPTGAIDLTESLTLKVTFWAEKSGLVFFLGEETCYLGVTLPGVGPWHKFTKELNARNRRLGLRCPFETDLTPAPETLKAPDFYVQTSQEWDAVECAASDGKTSRNWTTDTQALTRTHQADGSPYSVGLRLTEQEYAAGWRPDALERLTAALDADCILGLLYVSRLLAPPAPLPPRAYAGGWIDLDDVAAHVLPKPQSRKEREYNRRRVYEWLLFGARTRIVGKRSTPYFDKRTGNEIPTEIDTPLWSFMGRERPQDAPLEAPSDVPLRQEIVCSTEWTRITTSANTCQYLPLGERLGAIPGNKPSGAWARVVGLALAHVWRRNPPKALDGTLTPTRRELLTHFTPKVDPPLDVLKGDHPFRALKYWQDALGFLCERKFLAAEGEPSRKPAEVRATLPRYEWQNEWLDERVDLRPGPDMRPALEELAKSRPPESPKAIGPKTKRGGPHKGRRDAGG
jgi:hypothetical protein